MASLPVQGVTRGTWGTQLNDFLGVAHNADGTLKASVLGGGIYNAKAYNAVGDGSTDDTTALQSFINAVAAAHTVGYIPTGTYKITSKLNIPQTYGWKISGAGPEGTTITQFTDNTPVLDVGASAVDAMHSWEISDLGITYSSVQSSSNTGAVAIKFSREGFEGRLLRLNIKRGYIGIGANGTTPPWGVTYSDINFGSELSGSAIFIANPSGGGGPNNLYTRLFVTAANMVGPVFQLYCANSTMNAVEIITASQGAQLLLLKAGSHLHVDELKLEAGTYNASQSLVQLETNSTLRLKHFRMSNTITVNNAAVLTVLKPQGAGAGELSTVHVDRLDLLAEFNDTAKGYVIDCSSKSWNEILVDFGHITKVKSGGTSANGWGLQNTGSTSTAECIRTVGTHQLNKASSNQADADYTATLGGPDTVLFKTTFTASRNINLPASIDELWNGLRYRFVFKGSINGANTAVIKCNGTTLHTLSTDNYAVEFTYRRQSAGTVSSNWELTSKENLA